MERPQPEEISESLILKESKFCVRKSSMLCFQKHYKFLTSTLCNIEKKLERNLENSIVAFKSIPCTDLSKTAKILNKLTGDDPLVHEFSVLKLQKSAEHTEN